MQRVSIMLQFMCAMLVSLTQAWAVSLAKAGQKRSKSKRQRDGIKRYAVKIDMVQYFFCTNRAVTEHKKVKIKNFKT